ncbi:MAG: PH domain-containing protein [Thermoleophilia bacterium]
MADLMQGEDLIWRGRPSWRSMMAFYAKWTILALVPLVVVLVVRGVSDADWPWWIGLVITLAAIGLVLLIGWVRRVETLYTVTSHRIMIRRGILSRVEKSAHIDRVQNVNYSQNPFQRMFRVGDVEFDTAGTDDFEFRFAGVNDPRALRETIARAYGERVREIESGIPR